MLVLRRPTAKLLFWGDLMLHFRRYIYIYIYIYIISSERTLQSGVRPVNRSRGCSIQGSDSWTCKALPDQTVLHSPLPPPPLSTHQLSEQPGGGGRRGPWFGGGVTRARRPDIFSGPQRPNLTTAAGCDGAPLSSLAAEIELTAAGGWIRLLAVGMLRVPCSCMPAAVPAGGKACAAPGRVQAPV